MKKLLIFAFAAVAFAAHGRDNPAVLTNPTAPYLLYWDGERMQVGAWGTVTQENILLTQFGSAVAFTVTSEEDAWDAGDVKFNPTGASYEDYETIPCWNGAATTDGYISSDAYHTLANVRSGRGDICKLAGLTKADIDAGIYDNERFRLPTDAENMADYGSGTDGQSGYGLPAVASRNASGTPSGMSSSLYGDGFYWSSRPYNTTNGYNLIFDKSVVNHARFGFAIRCVPR